MNLQNDNHKVQDKQFKNYRNSHVQIKLFPFPTFAHEYKFRHSS